MGAFVQPGTMKLKMKKKINNKRVAFTCAASIFLLPLFLARNEK